MKSIHWSTAVASALFLTTSSGLLAASETDMSKQYTSCMAKANGANPDMIDCIMAEAKQQDARLNENYKRLMSKLSEERKKTLLEAQRAWIRFRDAKVRCRGPERKILPLASQRRSSTKRRD
jgi:uncharacterized protein YecT (DUF1311 family)